MRDHFILQLGELAAADSNIILITADLGFGVFDNYRKELPEQFLNVGVAEQHMTGLAAGMAMEGFTVFTYSIANFPTLRCLEQIRNDACYHNANVKVVAIGGGFSYGALGMSHHATEDLAIMRAIPELTVVSPCGLWEAMEATKAITALPGTCYMRLDKTFGDIPRREDEKFELGKARIVREGKDCAILVTGGILEEVVDAAEMLAAKGIECRIVSIHTIKPFDNETVCKAASETGALITVEEHGVSGGLGGLAAEVLMHADVRPGKFMSIGLKDKFSSIVGSQRFLRKSYGLDACSIAAKIDYLLNK